MRILHVATRHRLGGAERNLINIAKWEHRQGHEVHLAFGREADVSAVPAGLRVHRVGSLVREIHLLRDLQALRDLARLVRQVDADVVHTHQAKAGILGRIAARGSARVVVHTVHMATFGPGYSPMTSRVYRAAERLCASFTDILVFVGDGLRRTYLAAGIGREGQTLVVRSAIDMEAYLRVRQLGMAERAIRRRRFHVPDGAAVVVAAGALDPRKRYRMLIERLAPLAQARNACLLLAGEGPERALLDDLARRLDTRGRVRLLGHVAPFADLLAIADVFVHTSSAEGVPQVLIQASAAGLPIVATEADGVREVPEAPVTVVPGDGSGLLEAVVAVLDGPRPGPAPATAFDAWRAIAVERQLEALHRALVPLVRRSR